MPEQDGPVQSGVLFGVTRTPVCELAHIRGYISAHVPLKMVKVDKGNIQTISSDNRTSIIDFLCMMNSLL